MQAFFQFVNDHRVFAVLMFAMSLTAVTLVIWRLLLNFNARTNMNLFLPDLQSALQHQGVDGALEMCRLETGVIPRRVLAAGLENNNQGTAAMKRAMAHVIELEVLPDLNYLLPSILAIAKTATMVGLLGTVLSMIGTFQVLGDAARNRNEGGHDGGAATASKEIGLALFATALGLMTAIPLVYAHVLFKAWVHRFEIDMKNAAMKLVALIQAMKGAAPPTPLQSTVPRPAQVPVRSS
jgi:biopolymer transport protein ExbB